MIAERLTKARRRALARANLRADCVAMGADPATVGLLDVGALFALRTRQLTLRARAQRCWR